MSNKYLEKIALETVDHKTGSIVRSMDAVTFNRIKDVTPKKLSKKTLIAAGLLGASGIAAAALKMREKSAAVSEENKQVAKTFAIQAAAAQPAHLVGAAAGGTLGAKALDHRLPALASKLATKGKLGKALSSKLGIAGAGMAAGSYIGSQIAGGVADLASLKASLHGKVKEG